MKNIFAVMAQLIRRSFVAVRDPSRSSAFIIRSYAWSCSSKGGLSDQIATRLQNVSDHVHTCTQCCPLMIRSPGRMLTASVNKASFLDYRLISSHSVLSEQMQKEIDTVIGTERNPLMQDRKALPFTDAVIHEVQRYLDLVPLSLPHYATHDISFRGYAIPKVRALIPS